MSSAVSVVVVPAMHAVLFALAATGCGRLAFSGEQEQSLDAGADAPLDAPCAATTWRQVRVLDELDSDDPNFFDFSYSWGDGRRQIIFESSRNGGNVDLYLAVLDERTGRYSPPRPLTEVNTDDTEASPSLSESGLELYYTLGADKILRTARASLAAPFATPEELTRGAYGPDLGSGDLDLVYSGTVESVFGVAIRSRSSLDTAFGAPKIIPSITLGDNAGWPSLSGDGLELYYQSGETKPIFTARRPSREEPFAAPVALPELGNAADPDVSPDGQWLLYVSVSDNKPRLAQRVCATSP